MSSEFVFNYVAHVESTPSVELNIEAAPVESTEFKFVPDAESMAKIAAFNAAIEEARAFAATPSDALFLGIPGNEKELEKYINKAKAFAKLGVFTSTVGMENGVVIVNQIKPALFEFFVLSDIAMFGMTLDGTPVELNLYGRTIPAIPEQFHFGDANSLPVFTDDIGRAYDNFLSTGKFVARNLIDLFNSKTAEELSVFLAEYCGTSVDEQGWVSLLDFEETHFNSVEVNLATAEFRTNRIRKLRNKGYIKTIGEVDVMPLTALIAFQLVGSGINNQVQLEGFLAGLTQVFEEEDTYGKQMESHEQLRVIRAASVMLLEPVTTRGSQKFPFFYLKNSNKPATIEEAATYYLKKGIVCLPDKYYAKRLVVGAKGCAALSIWMSEDGQSMGYGTDCSKPSKAGARPWGSVTIAASQGYPKLILPSGKISDKPNPDFRPHKRSQYVLSTPDMEDIFIEGDMVWMACSNSRMDGNGSGNASSTVGYAHMVGKSVTGTLNSINFPAGMTIQEVAASVQTKLAAFIKKPKVRNVNGSVTLLKYHGKDLLRYSGQNQQILIDETCEYDVRCLITSNSINISLTVYMVSNGYEEPKVRGEGIKAVAKKTGMVILDDKGNKLPYHIHLGIECRKGDFQAMKHMYANSMPDTITRHICGVITTYDLDNNVLHSSDLADPNCLFYQWIQSRIKDVVLVHKWNLDDWNFFVKHHGDSIEKDLTFEIVGNVVTIWEKCEIIFGWYPLQLECSTVLESTNASGPILERIAAKYSFSETMGRKHDLAAQEQVQVFSKMAEMAFNVPGKFEVPMTSEQASNTINFPMIQHYNNSMLSLGSAKEVGDLLPYLAFNAYDEKVKKSLRKTALAVTKVMLYKPKADADRTMVDAKFAFIPLLASISKIMTIQVGWTWGMSAALYLGAWIKAHQFRNSITDCNGTLLATEKDCAEILKAASICSLIVHEGLSLAVDPKTLPLFFGDPNKPEVPSFRSSVKGVHNYNVDGKWINLTQEQTLDALMVQLEEVSGFKCDLTTMKYLLSAYRWVRGMGILESEGLGLGEGSTNKSLVRMGKHKNGTAFTFGQDNTEQFVNILGLDDVGTTVLMGLCRRMSQGMMGVRFDVDEFASYVANSENEVNSEFKSCWDVFDQYYKSVISTNNLIPPMLLDRIERVGSVWNELISNKVEEIKHYESGNGGRYRRSCAATELDIDAINLAACSRLDQGEALMYNKGVMSFHVEPGSAEYTHGAFETQLIHCSVQFVTTDGVTKCFPLIDADTKQFATSSAAWPATWAKDLPTGKWKEYFNRTTLDPKTILRKAAERYPFGTVVYANGRDCVESFIDFNAILRLGSFSAGGSATGIALRIVELLVNSSRVPSERAQGYEGEIYKSLAGLSGMMLKWMSPSNMKKAIRGSKDGAGCKVMTSTAPKVQDARVYYWAANKGKACDVVLVDGSFVPDLTTAKVFTIPVACINSKDNAKEIAGIFEGAIVDVGRTPMVATFLAVVLEDSSVSLGHLEISARYQGLVNHGDGDGDPVDFTKAADQINPENANAIFANNKFLV